ncbi:MAG: HEAT repeat domain-containing protein [Planctomycetes bacterium]|nr:HEAT repeat domain-containing protein [Planctomycetota bacterium]
MRPRSSARIMRVGRRRSSSMTLALLRFLLALLVSASPCLGGALGRAVGVELADAWDEARAAFEKAFRSAEVAARVAAVESLVKLGDPRGVEVLRIELEAMSTRVRGEQQRRSELEATLLRKRRLAEVRRERLTERVKSASDPEQKTALERQVAEVDLAIQEIAKAEKDQLAPLTASLESDQSVLAALRAGFPALIDALPVGRRSREVQNLKKNLLASESWEARVAGIESYSLSGDSGAADHLLGLIGKLLKEKEKAEAEMPAIAEDLGRVVKQLANERKVLGGNQVTQATLSRHNQIQAQLHGLSERIFDATRSVEAIAEALPAAIARLVDPERDKAIKGLKARTTSGPFEAKRAAVLALGRIPGDTALTALRELLLKKDDPGIRALAIDALAVQKDEASLDELLANQLRDTRWEVRLAAIRALASIRAVRSIPPLLVSLETETGRLQDEVEKTLQTLTSKSFNRSVELWKRWWAEAAPTFTLPIPQPTAPETEATDGPRFYGLTVVSRRVVFVLDCSGSMGFALDAVDDPARQGDPRYQKPPEPGESSRYDIAKQELFRALGGIAQGGWFNLVFYSDEVRTWKRKMTEMSDEVRAEVRGYVEAEIKPEGSTNIHGGLAAAFDLAGIGARDRYYDSEVDTIYFLSDGHPTSGEMLDREQILEYVRRRNALSKIVIHTIGMGEDHDAILMRRLAEENGGKYVSR